MSHVFAVSLVAALLLVTLVLSQRPLRRRRARKQLRQRLTILLPGLERVNQQLRTLSSRENKLTALVDFFDITSWWHDGGLREVIELSRVAREPALEAELLQLSLFIAGAGRNLSGMNRTNSGERVTAEKVFIGDVYGLWTKSVSYWLSHRPELEQETDNMPYRDGEQMSAWETLSWKAEDFMESWVKVFESQLGKVREKAEVL